MNVRDIIRKVTLVNYRNNDDERTAILYYGMKYWCVIGDSKIYISHFSNRRDAVTHLTTQKFKKVKKLRRSRIATNIDYMTWISHATWYSMTWFTICGSYEAFHCEDLLLSIILLLLSFVTFSIGRSKWG